VGVEESHSRGTCILLILAVIAFLLTLAPALSAAQPEPGAAETPFYSLIVTASKFDRDEEVTVLDVRTLEQAGAVTVADALRLTPEVVVLQYGPRGSIDKIGVKGAGFTQALLLLDGSPSPALGAPVVLDLPLSMVERIEIIKGRRSLGGAGAINIVTKAAQATAAHVSSASGFAGRDISAVDAGSFNTTDYRASASMTSEPSSVPGLYDRQSYVQLRFDHEFSPRSELSASFTFGVAERPLGEDGSFAAQGAERLEDAAALDVSYAYELPQGLVETKGFARIARRGFELFSGFSGEKTSLVGTEVRATLETADRALTVGALATREAGYTVAFATPVTVAESRMLFSELTQNVGENTSATIGARAHFAPAFAPVLSPSLLVTVRPLPQITLRASAAHAFRTPGLTELKAQAAGDPKLEPQRGWRYELGLSREIGRGGIDIGVYQERIADRISWKSDGQGAVRPVNLSETVAQGVEVGLRAALGRGLSSILSWRSIDDREVATGAKVPYVPSSEVRLGLYYAGEATRGNLELQVLGERLDGIGASFSSQAVANGRIVHSAGRNLDIFVEGYNLFDVQEEEPGEALSTSAGRTVLVGASLKF